MNKGAQYEPYSSGDPSNKGYRYDEAREFIEFCVELDNQDDRLKHKDDRTLYPTLDPSRWDPLPIYDSRAKVAKDVVAFKTGSEASELQHWSKLLREIVHRANTKYHGSWNEDTISSDPDLNGFGPWQNAWLLYQGRGAFEGAYTIAIRGTVFSNTSNVAEDAIFHPVIAQEFLSKSVSFADSATATLHSGFTHATFTVMLDDRYGVLRVLHDQGIPANSRLYIVGHSQGAAMATIAHAFLHYAMRNDDASEDRFGLKDKRYKLKSYAFAQPKPGNFGFTADFARFTQEDDNALVINNDIDPVPKVPLTLQATGNCYDNAPMESYWHSLKVEETHGQDFATRAAATRSVFAYIEGWYNTTRMHSSLDYKSPMQFERDHHAKLLKAANDELITISRNNSQSAWLKKRAA